MSHPWVMLSAVRHSPSARAAIAFLTLALTDQSASETELAAALSLPFETEDPAVVSLKKVLTGAEIEPAILIDGLTEVVRTLLQVVHAASGKNQAETLSWLGTVYAEGL